MFTTADLPESFRAPTVDADTERAVRASGLRLPACTHGRADCPTCVTAAARELLADKPEPVGG